MVGGFVGVGVGLGLKLVFRECYCLFWECVK